jgi:hypothetical protein
MEETADVQIVYSHYDGFHQMASSHWSSSCIEKFLLYQKNSVL